MTETVSKTRIDIVRHGEHQLGDVLCGVTDPLLSDKGWKQMQLKYDRLSESGQQWDLCVTSPRKRCLQFAQSLERSNSLDCVVEKSIGEVDFGKWEGLSYEQINAHYPGQWRDWLNNPTDPAPHGGEAYGDFINRVNDSFTRLILNNRGKNLLMFSHGGVIRAIFHRILGMDHKAISSISVPHACHTRIEVYHDKSREDWFQLESHNGI